MKRQWQKAAISAALVVTILAATGQGAISGQNSILDSVDGRIFIPLKPRTSGDLGDGDIGLRSDAVLFSMPGQSATGSVSFVISFDISAEFPDGFFVDPAGASLLIVTLRDFDFVPVGINGVRYREEMELTFLANAGDTPAGGPDLVINQGNYGNFLGAGFVPTRGATLDYAINMQDDLGLVQADYDAMNADKEFALLVTLRSYSQAVAPGVLLFRNSSETLRDDNFVGFGAIPEPATMMILLPGLLLLAKRRR